MMDILDEGHPAHLGIRAVVLQPVDPRITLLETLRAHLWRQGYGIERERHSMDQGRHYMSIRATLGSASPTLPSSRELLLGSETCLRAHAPAPFTAFLRQQQRVIRKEASGMRQARSPAAADGELWQEALVRRERWIAMIEHQISRMESETRRARGAGHVS